ncbi:MAG: transglycosylase SLT domain-containing protein [Thermodesulfobacteriota bacterium]
MKKTALIILALFLLTISYASANQMTLDSDNYAFKAVPCQLWEQKKHTMDEIQYYSLKESIKKNIKTKAVEMKYLNKIPMDELLYMENMRKRLNIPFSIYYRLIYQESRFKHHNSKSEKNAIGYFQITSNTFKWFTEKKLKKDNLNIYNPKHNIYVGASYLKYLASKCIVRDKVKWRYTLSSYNAGFSNRYRSLKEFPETIKYVRFIYSQEL